MDDPGHEGVRVRGPYVGATWESLFATADIAGLDAWYDANTGHDPTRALLDLTGQQLSITSTWLATNEDDDHVYQSDGRWVVDGVACRNVRLSVGDITLRNMHVDANAAAVYGITTAVPVVGVVVERCTFTGGGSERVAVYFPDAIDPYDVIVRRCRLSGWRNGIYAIGGLLGEENLIYDLNYTEESHNTSMSIRARNVTLRRNRTRGDTSGVSLYGENTPYTNIVVEQNVLSAPNSLNEVSCPGDKPYATPASGETRVLRDNLLETGSIGRPDNFTTIEGNRRFDGTEI